MTPDRKYQKPDHRTQEKISDAIIYISKRTELTFAPLKLNRVAISLYDIVKSTGERKDAFRFTYQAEGCTKGRLYKCLSHSERLRAGMEVSEMVKRLTGRNYPVFADDMESIEDLSNVKPTGQVIMARVVPHAPLSVQPLQPSRHLLSTGGMSRMGRLTHGHDL